MHELILKKENIITLYSYSVPLPRQLYITMELAVNDLSAHFNAKRNKCLSLNCIRSIARQALSGLDYLHGNGVTHRDLKLSNILVTKWDQITDTLKIKLADFGLASKESEPRSHCGTRGFRAPKIEFGELREDGKLVYAYTTAVDIWTMGMIFLTLVNRQSRRDQPAIRLISKMMDLDPDKRPTAVQCLQSPWLREEEPISEPIAQKRKASHDATNHRAKGPGLGD